MCDLIRWPGTFQVRVQREPPKWLEWSWPGGGSSISPIAGDSGPGQGRWLKAGLWTEPLGVFTFRDGKKSCS